LVVEDEPEFLRQYCEAITRESGLRLVGAVTTLAAGVALIESATPDVLVVDLGLPDGNGADLIRTAAKRRPDCDALVVTVFGDDQHVIDAIEAGADRLHTKGQSARGTGALHPRVTRRRFADFTQHRAKAACAHAGSSGAARRATSRFSADRSAKRISCGSWPRGFRSPTWAVRWISRCTPS
jgi:DNA-binding NarL/FixJ family response regulator